MSVNDRLGRLPVEVWQMAFEHLSQTDLFNLRSVNSALGAIASPFLYRYGLLTKLGLHFPGAPHPYPFTDLPELGHIALRKSDLDRIVHNLRRLEIPTHKSKSCSTVFKGVWPEGLRLNADVLSLEVEQIPEAALRPRERPVFPECFVHTEYNESLGSAMDDHGASNSEVAVDTTCLRACSFLDEPDLWSARVRKVVIRGAPLSWKSQQRPHQVPGGRWATEYVLVVDSAKDWISWIGDVVCMCPEYHRLFGPTKNPIAGFSPFPHDSTSLKRLTIIFWTESPESPWLPPCGHFTKEEHWTSRDVCNSYTEIWDAIVATVRRVPSLQQIFLVNTGAMSEQPSAGVKRRARKPYKLFDKTKIADELQTRLQKAYPKNRGLEQPELSFQTVNEWAEAEDWEDVFNVKEIAPFLERAE